MVDNVRLTLPINLSPDAYEEAASVALHARPDGGSTLRVTIGAFQYHRPCARYFNQSIGIGSARSSLRDRTRRVTA